MDVNVARDVIGRKLKAGDYVFYYQHIYVVKDVLNNKSSKTLKPTKSYRISMKLADPSPTTKVKTCQAREVCLLPEKDVTLWLLQKGN